MQRYTNRLKLSSLCVSLPATAFLLLFSVAHRSTAGETAANETFPLDSTRSYAEFQVHVMWLIPVNGKFGTMTGSVSVDHFRSTVQVDARIAADTVRMNDENYEDKIKSAEFFDVTHHPEIHFISEPFAVTRLETGGKLSGTLELRGMKSDVQFTLHPSACTGAVMEGCPVHAEGHIRRSDFGMRSRRAALSDRVDIDLVIYINGRPPTTQ